MAEVVLASASEKQKWISDYFKDYVRASGFSGYMGRSKNSVILTKYELTEEAGKTINMPLVAKLSGSGVTGSTVLDGNEEELANYNFPISVDWRRNGVRVPKSQSYKTEINLLGAARDALQDWESEKLRDDIIKAFLQVITAAGTDGASTVVDWADATAANKNAYAVLNQDRLPFGKLVSNYSATFSTALGNLDTTDDKCTASSMSLAKRRAKAASPIIRPYKSKVGQEYYVAFHGSRTFRDLKADSTITQANREARPRDVEANPLFQDGDLIYDGIVHREVPEIDTMCTALGGFDGQGGSSADVRPVFVCGQQAVGIAWGQEPMPKTDSTKDYGFRPGVAIEELLGVKKLACNGKQHGVLTAFFAAAADS